MHHVDNPFRSRAILLGIIAWVSVSLIAAGWISSKSELSRQLWVCTGLLGLASAVGLTESLKRNIVSLRREVRRQQELLDKFIAETKTDPLTSLASRCAFDEQLTLMLAKTDQEEETVSVVLLDVDHFNVGATSSTQ